MFSSVILSHAILKQKGVAGITESHSLREEDLDAESL